MDFPLDTFLDQLKIALYIGLPTLVVCFGLLALLAWRDRRKGR